MTDVPPRLLQGYQAFRRQRYPAQAALFGAISAGQAPHTMVIACADSRIDPAMILTAAPGELFVVRNIANLVPPFGGNKGLDGTVSALEYAVTALDIDHILVLGHAQCGGIAASLQAAEGQPVGRFVAPWVALVEPDRASEGGGDYDSDGHHQLELQSIRRSLARLEAYPFVADATRDRGLRLHGAWFSIADGRLYWLDRKSGDFVALPLA